MRALIVSIAPDWVGIARLPGALRKAGFAVRALCPKDSYLAQTSYLEAAYLFEGQTSPRQHMVNFQSVCESFSPDLVIPGDDSAVQILHRQMQARDQSVLSANTFAILERSLGDLSRCVEREEKSLLGQVAAATGVVVPPQVVSPSMEEAQQFVRQHGLPAILKADYSCAGRGVRICRTEDEILPLLRDPTWMGTGLRQSPTGFSLQKYIVGETAAVSLSAHRGQILAGFAFAKVQTYPAVVGPVSVARILDRPDIVAAAGRVVEHLGFTGFCGLDFMIEESSQAAYLIDFNSRPTPTCHLGALLGADLCGSLYAALAGNSPIAPRPGAGPELIALFPSEWARDRNSTYLRTAYHDVPWDDLKLLRYLINK